MASLRQFSRRTTVLGRAVNVNIDRLVRRVAITADQTVVMATPVDTGRARSNWIVSLDVPARRAIEARVPGLGGSTAQQNTSAALEQGRYVIGAYRGGLHRAIVISNSLHYIGSLNAGSSRQAPAGFVLKAVQAAVDQVKGSKILP